MSLSIRELRNTIRQIKRFRVVVNYLVSYLLFNDGIQTVLVIAGAFAADTLGIGLAFNMATIAIIQFVAVPGAMFFSKLAYRTSTKAALGVSLMAWIVIVLFGVALAPLTPTEHAGHDFQLDFDNTANQYRVAAAPGGWDEDDALLWQGNAWPLQQGDTLAPQQTRRPAPGLPRDRRLPAQRLIPGRAPGPANRPRPRPSVPSWAMALWTGGPPLSGAFSGSLWA